VAPGGAGALEAAEGTVRGAGRSPAPLPAVRDDALTHRVTLTQPD
jgi:hypothetical protein